MANWENKITKDFSVHKWVCLKCGMIYNRDVNAAKKHIKKRIRIIEGWDTAG